MGGVSTQESCLSMSRLLLTFAFTVCFSLATWLAPRFQGVHEQSEHSGTVMAVLMGDSRKMFANHFFAKADAYFHNGRYPTIFDRTPSGHSHMTERSHEGKESEAEEKDDDARFFFMGPPKDWIERFGRHFMFTEHAHLEGNGQEREILPWLRISAELDPHRVDTYVTAAYWLRKRLDKADQAEQFLRLGLKYNPDSYEILLELGCVYFENQHDPDVARNLLEMALNKWHKQKVDGAKPDELVCMEILGQLVLIEEQEKDFSRLISYLEQLKKLSPFPDSIEQQIQVAKAKLIPFNANP